MSDLAKLREALTAAKSADPISDVQYFQIERAFECEPGPIRAALLGYRCRDAEVEALKIALHDAIRRPMGQVPVSAEPFYNQEMADKAEARRRLSSAGKA